MIQHLYLHIGHSKTGTGSLQQTMRASAQALAGEGLFYYAGTSNHHPIGHAAHRATRDWRRARQTSADFFGRLARTRAPVALLSSETFTRLSDAEAEALIERLGQHAQTITVLLYVRHPVSFASSAAHESVRIGRPLARAVEKPRVLPLRKLCERWERASGGRLVVRPFDRRQLVNGDVVDDVLSVIGCRAVASALTRVSLNDPLSILSVILLDRAHRYGKLPRDATRMFERIKGPRYVLPEEALDRVRHEARPHLDFLAERYGIRLSEPSDSPQPLASLDEETLDSLAAVLRDSAAYAHKLDRSFLGRVLEQRSPFTRRDDIPAHWLAPVMRRLGLQRRLGVRVNSSSLA